MDVIGTGFKTMGDKLIVKLSTVPEMNREVFTEDGRKVGKVVDIIGPVASPFAVVSGNVAGLQGKAIAVKPPIEIV